MENNDSPTAPQLEFSLGATSDNNAAARADSYAELVSSVLQANTMPHRLGTSYRFLLKSNLFYILPDDTTMYNADTIHELGKTGKHHPVSIVAGTQIVAQLCPLDYINNKLVTNWQMSDSRRIRITEQSLKDTICDWSET